MYQRPKEHGVQVFIGGMMVDETTDTPAKKTGRKQDDHGQSGQESVETLQATSLPKGE